MNVSELKINFEDSVFKNMSIHLKNLLVVVNWITVFLFFLRNYNS